MKSKPQEEPEEGPQTAIPAAPEHYLLRLFVTGTTPRSARAIQNIRAVCERQLQGRYELEVIDLYQHPEQAGPEQVVVTPTLVKKLPRPMRKLIGDLSDYERVLAGLDILPLPPLGEAHPDPAAEELNPAGRPEAASRPSRHSSREKGDDAV